MSASRSTSHTHATTAIVSELTVSIAGTARPDHAPHLVEGWSAILMSGAAFAQDAMKKDAMAKDASADAMHKDAMGRQGRNRAGRGDCLSPRCRIDHADGHQCRLAK